MIFLALKTEDGRITGKISFYCRMLGISRQGFYKYLANKDRPWKYQDLAEAMKEQFPDAELTIMCAAVADYRPVHCAEQKIKKSGGPLFLELERTEDILLSLGQRKRSSQILVGFAAETQDLALYAQQKLRKKNLDWIIANEVGLPGRGFASDFNAVTVYGADGSVKELPLMEKERLAEELIRFLVQGAPLF